MTKHGEKPDPAQAARAGRDDALPDEALEKISGGTPQASSNLTKKLSDTTNTIVQNIK